MKLFKRSFSYWLDLISCPKIEISWVRAVFFETINGYRSLSSSAWQYNLDYQYLINSKYVRDWKNELLQQRLPR